MRKWLCGCFLVILVISGIGCQESVQTRLLGHWKDVDEEESFEFQPGGTFKFKFHQAELSDISEGTGQFFWDQNRYITLNFQGVLAQHLGTPVMRVEFEKDFLHLIDAKGKVSRYRRVPSP